MTSQDPKAAGAASAPRPLRRRADDRVLAGVAGGLADYLNIDPVIVRAVFVGLMIFGGAGLVLYVVGWVLIPAEGSGRSLVEAALARVTSGPLGIALLIVAAIVFIWLALPDRGPFGDGPAWFYFLFGLVTAGVLLLLRGGRTGDREAAGAVSVPLNSASPVDDVPSPTYPVVARRPRIERGPLGWLVIAVALLAVALLALVDQATARTVLLAQFLGAVLAMVGLGLVIGSWWGNARLLILPALLLAPLGFAASFITVPLEGGTGYAEFTPTSLSEVRDEYRLTAGELRLDLRELEPASEPIRIVATAAIGSVSVILPDGVDADVSGAVGLGGMSLIEAGQNGTHLANRVLFENGDADSDLILDLAVGIGNITVWPAEWYEFGPPWVQEEFHEAPGMDKELPVEATVAPTAPPSPTPLPTPAPTAAPAETPPPLETPAP